MNSVSVIGRLTRDPELRHTPSGESVCNFSVAVDRAGDKEEDGTYGPGFFDVTVWGRSAESCAQYLVKGQQVGVNGRLFHHRWEAADGAKRSKVEIVAGAFGVDFLAKAGEGRGDDDGQTTFEPVAQTAAAKTGGMLPPDEDIPF